MFLQGLLKDGMPLFLGFGDAFFSCLKFFAFFPLDVLELIFSIVASKCKCWQRSLSTSQNYCRRTEGFNASFASTGRSKFAARIWKTHRCQEMNRSCSFTCEAQFLGCQLVCVEIISSFVKINFTYSQILRPHSTFNLSLQTVKSKDWHVLRPLPWSERTDWMVDTNGLAAPATATSTWSSYGTAGSSGSSTTKKVFGQKNILTKGDWV